MEEVKLNKLELEQSKKDFLERVKLIQDEVVGSETYGDTIEFYDEDGVVLMVSTIKEDDEETGLQVTEFSFKSDKYTEEENQFTFTVKIDLDNLFPNASKSEA